MCFCETLGGQKLQRWFLWTFFWLRKLWGIIQNSSSEFDGEVFLEHDMRKEIHWTRRCCGHRHCTEATEKGPREKTWKLPGGLENILWKFGKFWNFLLEILDTMQVVFEKSLMTFSFLFLGRWFLFENTFQTGWHQLERKTLQMMLQMGQKYKVIKPEKL